MTGYTVAIVGAASDLGREVQAVLRERLFPVAGWRLVDDDEDADDDELADALVPPDAFDVSEVDLAFLCGGTEQSASFGARALEAGVVVIDLVQALSDVEGAQYVVPEVNADVVGVEPGPLCCPVPGAAALAVVLRPLDEAAEIKRVVVTAFEPVSIAGRPGIEELAQQTRDLLSGESVEHAVFPHRIAFNLIPQVGDFVSGGRTRGEWLVESQTRRVLDLPDLPLTVTSVCVPTFYGQAYVLHVETERPLDAVAAAAVLRNAPGILLVDASTGADYPTLADTMGSEATHVGRVRDDPTVPYGLALWVVVDGLRKGGAVTAVQIAERAMRAES
ncbi:MAG: aspartate-semialdehyde dehydrogenase [Myxococcota bacterium]